MLHQSPAGIEGGRTPSVDALEKTQEPIILETGLQTIEGWVMKRLILTSLALAISILPSYGQDSLQTDLISPR
jgi:hypothetical protein